MNNVRNDQTNEIKNLQPGFNIDPDAILYMDPCTKLKYKGPIQTVFTKSYVVVIRDGKNNTAQPRHGANLPKEIDYTKDFFPYMDKPSIFARKEEYDVQIFHFDAHNEQRYMYDVVFEAKDRKTDQVICNIKFEGLVLQPSLGTAFPNKLFALLKELDTPIEPGKVLMTGKQLQLLAKEVGNYLLGDLKSLLPPGENVVIPPVAKSNPKEKELRKQFTRALSDVFHKYNCVMLYQGAE